MRGVTRSTTRLGGTICILLLLICNAADSGTTTHPKVKKTKEEKKMNCDRQTQRGESTEGNPVDTKSGDCHHLNSVDVLSKQAASPGKGDAKSAKEPDEQTQLNSFNDYNKTHNEPPIGDATMDDAGTIK